MVAQKKKSGTVIHVCNPGAAEAETGRPLELAGASQPTLISEQAVYVRGTVLGKGKGTAPKK